MTRPGPTHIGVLSPSTGGFYFGELLVGIVREAAAAGAHVTLMQTIDAGQTGDDFVAAPDDLPATGWAHLDGVVTLAWAAGPRTVGRLRERGTPVVMISNDMPVDAASVVVDNDEGVRSAVHHLSTEHGHTRMAFVGHLGQSDMRERYEAFSAAMEEAGLADRATFHSTADHVENGGAGVAAAIAQAHRDGEVTAVVAATDRVALGLMEALRPLGVRVPEDVALVGFDDVESGWTSNPPLSTVNQRFAEQGSAAARLLLAEIAGRPIEHTRRTVSSAFIPRASCGCGNRLAGASHEGVRAGTLVVTTVLAALGVTDVDADLAEVGAALASADTARLDEVIYAAITATHPDRAAPESLASFAETYVRLLGDLGRRLVLAGLPGAEVLETCVGRMTAATTQAQAVHNLERIVRLSASLGEQYDVGMGLLGTVDDDPGSLRWLTQVSVRVGCLALWDGDPADGVLRITGVYDPDGRLTGLGCGPVPVDGFPCTVLNAVPDSSAGEVAYVIPVRGPHGDHGMLWVVGPVDTEFGTGRATYNHWAALLGVALRDRRLLQDVRRSEARHTLAARATHDGLWEIDLDQHQLYLSERCREILGIDADAAVDVAAWNAVMHPDDRALVAARMTEAVQPGAAPVEIEYRVRGPEGMRWVVSRGLAVPGEDGRGVVRLVGSLSDIHPRKELEEKLRLGALYDQVTGLPNRRFFHDRLSWAIEQVARRPAARFAVVFLDLDGFKLVNDSLGHLMGDELLKVVAERLRTDLRAVDTAARFGGDEFAVLLSDPVPAEVLVIATRIQERIAAPIMLGETEVSVTASIGITTSESGYTTAEDVLRDADTAMYHAKATERGTASVFDPTMHARATGRLKARSELRTALAERQFVVHYQPIVALDGAVVSHFEALVRWNHPTRGLLLPGTFLPDMEDNGSIVALGTWLIDSVAGQIAAWRTTYPGPVSVAVNLSHREFWSEALIPTLTTALDHHQIPPSALVLEITESVIMTDPTTARDRMTALHDLGLRLHIDDFGTGQSSLGALRTFPLDALKIDGSFIKDLGTTQTSELVSIIVAMGRTLGLDVVAECVETPQQAQHLTTIGCHNAQGWLYAHALPPDQAATLLGGTFDGDGALTDIDTPGGLRSATRSGAHT